MLMKSIVIRYIIGVLFQIITSIAALEISENTVIDNLATVTDDLTIDRGSYLLVTYDPSVSINSNNIVNNGNLCIGTASTTDSISINIAGSSLNNKGKLIIDNGPIGTASTLIKLATLTNSGYLRGRLNDGSDGLTVTDSFINTGYIWLGYSGNVFGSFTINPPNTGIQNSGTISFTDSNVTINFPVTGGGCMVGSTSRDTFAVNTDYSIDQTIYLTSTTTKSITILGSGKYIPVIRGVDAKTTFQFGRQVRKSNNTKSVISYNTTSGILTTWNVYGIMKLDIGTGYDATGFISGQVISGSCSTCYAPIISYSGIVPTAGTSRPSICDIEPDRTMALCPLIISSSSSALSSSYAQSSSSLVPSSSYLLSSLETSSTVLIPTSSSLSQQHTASKTIVMSSSQCVITETAMEYFSTLYNTTYSYITVATINEETTDTYITTSFSSK
ncbi:uncharacterized protein NDAI_0G02960 [Naumovozyma dairenensis CBS 421]|uniref:Hyphally-regulated cell wall protein N-terminal domain-containing protein n=1 Tax=Naumovozyma dairenensis (strain ATCC 10597 / BCRC 20456 / CBS 421 / NBRC 0211 / NRRL Y-12639) TaxID=1071378 RepID=G0WE62_NAUDC|nr:hypothetical protein NDAI_0G02960 [Naumovozyma dairenensis CBS 421]CCD26073.2 hypothetical protein NDAI_0G02960 [Naumovozyma dairenensis CBS 421]